MSKIIVPRAVDRSKYPKSMMFVDKAGNVCIADKAKPLTDEERASRLEARKEKKSLESAERLGARKTLIEAKKKARKEPSVENAQAYEEAKAKYEEMRS